MSGVLRVLSMACAIAVPVSLISYGALRCAAAGMERLAPHVSLTRADGTAVAALGAGRTTFVEFFTTWCETCRIALPRVQAYASAHSDISFVAVDIGEAPAVAAAITQHWGLRNVVFDPRAAAARAFEVQSVPTTYAIDAAGFIRDVRVGFEDDVERGLERIRVRLRGDALR